MRKFILPLSLAIFVASCDNEDGSYSDITRDFSVAISISSEISSPQAAPSSKVVLSYDGQQGYDVVWSESDKLGGWSLGDESFSEFAISQYSADESTFSGTIGSYVEEIYFVHPLPESISVGGEFSLDLSTQSVEADLSHLSGTTYMVSGAVSVSDVDASAATPSVKHVGAIIDLNVTCIDAASYELVALSVESESLPIGATVDLQSGVEDGYITSTTTGAIDIAVPNFTADAQGLFPTVSFNILPFSLDTNGQLAVTATFYDTTTGYYFQGERVIVNSGSSAVTFGRATRNSVASTMRDGIGLIIDINNIEGSSTSTVEADMSIATLSAYKVYYYKLMSNKYILALAGGTYSNVDHIEGLTKIVVEYLNTSYLTVYEGSASGVKSTKVDGVASSDGATFTYTFSDSAQYFVLANENEVSSSNINSIKIFKSSSAASN